MTEELHDDEHELPEDDAVIGRALKVSMIVLVAIGLVVAGVIFLSGEEPEEEEVLTKDTDEIERLDAGDVDPPNVAFRDVTEEAGIRFLHVNGATGEKYLPETMGGGAAFFDYDADGDQDLLCINGGGPLEGGEPYANHALYRNDGSGRFEDVTEASGLRATHYGMGVAVGDYDGDGFVDVYVTGVGRSALWRNAGDGTFQETTEQAGVAGPEDQWTTSAGFLDYDRDGDLDLFVCHYVLWSPGIDTEIAYSLNGKDRAYGPPTNYRGQFSSLYRNEGDGTFRDVSEEAGIQVRNEVTGDPMGKALGVSFCDFNADGLPDITVANDTVQNHLFLNLGDGTFDEVGYRSGLGFDRNGKATGAMGIDIADYRSDGTVGICVGNFANEMSSLYVSRPGETVRFTDDALMEGIGSPSRQRLTFGVLFLDYDLDGREDLLQVNGHLEETIQEVQSSQRYLQPPQLFWNAGPGGRRCFVEVPVSDAGDLDATLAGRGSCYADIDGDGDLDVLLMEVAGRARLLRNDQALGHRWLRVRLEGRRSHASGLGAWVTVVRGDGALLRRQVQTTKSYLSQSELPVTFGLGAGAKVDRVEVAWPSGARQVVEGPVELGRVLTVVEPE